MLECGWPPPLAPMDAGDKRRQVRRAGPVLQRRRFGCEVDTPGSALAGDATLAPELTALSAWLCAASWAVASVTCSTPPIWPST